MKNKILKVTVTIILIIAMIISDFIVVGMNLATYAQENENDATNHENIKFIAGFKTGENLLSQAEYKIDDTGMKLYIKVSVKNEGYFDGVIVLENSNFNIKQNQVSEYISKIEGNTIILNRVRAGNVAEIEVGIEPVVEELYGEDMLNKASVLNLTGDYKDNTETSIAIESEKKVSLSLLAPSNLQTSLTGRIITNKIYKIGEENKRIVQIEANSEVVENTYPIKATTFELELPEGVENIEVISKGTFATNGEADRRLDANSYKFNKENNKISVTIENTRKDGRISWKKDVLDNIIVTLTLDADFVIDDKEYVAKVNVEFYGKELKKEEKEAKYNLANQAEGIITAAVENKEEIYKGKIYSKEEREYKTTTNIEVNYANLVDTSSLEEKTTYRTEIENKQANIEYKSTTIKKSEIEKILGQDGIMTIKNGQGEEVAKVTKDTAVDENGNVIIQYSQEVKELKVEITNAVSTGVIRLNHTKVIKPEEYSQQEIQQLKNLVEEVNVKYNDEIKSKVEQITELKDIRSEVALTVVPQTISAEESKQMQIAITLKTDKECYELFENPVFTIAMPKGVTINSLSEATISATNEELAISKLDILNSGEIRLEISGKQQKYVTSNINTQISFLANIEIEKLMPNTAGTIKMQYTNKAKTYEVESKTINVIASNSKVVTHVKLENYNGQGHNIERYSYSKSEIEGELPLENTDVIQVPLKYTMVNNYDSSMEVVALIVVRFTDKYGNNKTLLSYGETQVTIEANSTYVIEKTFEIPAGLYYSEKVEVETQLEYNYSGTSYKLRNDIDLVTEEKEGIRDISIIDNKVQVETFAQLGDGTAVKQGDALYNEQIIKYIMEITNISSKTISNLKITNKQENGNIYDIKEIWITNWVESTEPFIEHQYGELEENTKTFEVGTLEPGETKEIICRVVVKKVEPDNITTANISILADEIEEYSIKPITNSIKDASIKIYSRKYLNEEVKIPGDSTLQILSYVENLTGTEINNLKAKLYLSDGLAWSEKYVIEALDLEDYEFDIIKNIKYNEKENYLEFDVTKLEANQTIIISSYMYIEPVPMDKFSVDENVYIDINNVVGNDVNVNVLQTATTLSISQKVNIDTNQKVKNGEKVIISGEITNTGNIDTQVRIEDYLPNGLDVSKVEIIRNGQSTDKTAACLNGIINIDSPLKKGEKIVINIEVIVNTSRITADEVKNKIIVSPLSGEMVASEEIIIQIDSDVSDGTEIQEPDTELPGEETENKDPEVAPDKPGEDDTEKPDSEKPEDENPEDENPDDEKPDDEKPDDENPDDENPDDEKPGDEKPNVQEPKYTISGYAWIDKNQNGKMEDNEGIQNVAIKVIDINNKNSVLKDKNGNEIEAKTDKNGKYEIKDIQKGKYNLIFKYDVNVYEIKKNAIIKDYIIEITKEKVAITNNINLQSDQTVDLQLVELTEFDLKIDKYISKVIVQTQNGTKTSEYANKQLVREEIQSKYLTGATVLVEYTIEITNIGELLGYATEVVDYLPKDMAFHSELNTQWYAGEDGNLYNTSLASTEINPGESKTIKLILIKTMTKNNTGVTSNIVEISNTSNNKEYSDIDSSNNQSKAEILINPATGRVLSYLISVLSAIVIVALGMYIIKKKVMGKE